MIEVFGQIKAPVDKWLGMISQGIFTEEEIAVVKSMGNDVDKELKRVKKNGEIDFKANYVEFLKMILSMIESIP